MQSNTITSLKDKSKIGVVPQNKPHYHKKASIECNEVGTMNDKPDYIQKIEHINGFKVVMTCPEMTKEEYIKKEQMIVNTILKCLSKDTKNEVD